MADTKHDDGEQAFPHDGQANYAGGVTLLDWFAGQALLGIWASDGPVYVNKLADCNLVTRAETAYRQAAAMIAEKRRRESAK